jgi:hypothetical protein
MAYRIAPAILGDNDAVILSHLPDSDKPPRWRIFQVSRGFADGGAGCGESPALISPRH